MQRTIAHSILNFSKLSIVVAFLAAPLAGCNEYLDRHDRLAMSAGDAVEANKVTHVVDPWPREGFDTRPRTIGQRVTVSVQRYNDGGRPGAPAGGVSVPTSMTASATGSATTR